MPFRFQRILRLLVVLAFALLTSCAQRAFDNPPQPLAWREGNALTTLPNGRNFYPAMLRELSKAKQSITFEAFAYVDSPIATKITTILQQKALQGIPVHLILDDIGSKNLKKSHRKALRSAGVDLRIYHPFTILRPGRTNNRTHRKILIIDGKTAFTGGAGIAWSWEHDWRDTAYRLTGPAVADLQHTFTENWQELTGEKLTGPRYFPPLRPVGTKKVAVVADSPSTPGTPLATAFYQTIARAQKTLFFQQAYFVPSPRFRRAILEAKKRGVRIVVLLSGPNIDSKVTRHASQNFWRQYLNAEIELYQYNGKMMHHRLVIADGRDVIVGSGNLDDRAFFINDEANLHIRDRAFAREQEQAFFQDLQTATRLTKTTLKNHLAPWWKRWPAQIMESQL